MRIFRAFCKLSICGVILIVAGCGTKLEYKAPVSGFRPTYPEVTWSAYPNRAPDLLNWPIVDSLQPTLRWEPFPGEHQTYEGSRPTPFVTVDPGSVRDVKYDLRIWTIRGRIPVEIAYESDGLTEPFHKLERALKPDTEYYWSVRARFSLDGKPRVSEWSLSQIPCTPDYGLECARGVERRTGRIPPLNYYRFKTPTQ